MLSSDPVPNLRSSKWGKKYLNCICSLGLSVKYKLHSMYISNSRLFMMSRAEMSAIWLHKPCKSLASDLIVTNKMNRLSRDGSKRLVEELMHFALLFDFREGNSDHYLITYLY